MKRGSSYSDRPVKVVSELTLEKGAIKEFHEAYKKFWAKRGVDISDNMEELPKKRNLSDPICGDPIRLRKAIEYGRSYRKEKK